MLRDMGVMVGAQVGASVANQTVNEQFNDMLQALSSSQTNLNISIQVFQHGVLAAQSAQIKSSYNFFKQAQTNISNLLAQQQVDLQQMATYIQSAISRQQPQAEYVTSPATYDQFFTLGTMFTPQGPIWKNPFPVGNWEYDQATDSFWQMSYAELNTAGDLSNPSALNTGNAPNNSIFTEWITRQPSYQIECEITLYATSDPTAKTQNAFFVGLIFNKARWISGDEMRLQKYRLFGIYGASNKTVQLCYAEAMPQTTTQAKTKDSSTPPTYLYPFEQIVSGANISKTSVDSTLFSNLTTQPVTFRLKIINSPNQIQYKFWPTSTPEPNKFITVSCKNPDLYLYHGIGFMAPGAIAQFKLIQPTSLLYTATAQTAFANKIQSFIQASVAQRIDESISKTATKSNPNQKDIQ